MCWYTVVDLPWSTLGECFKINKLRFGDLVPITTNNFHVNSAPTKSLITKTTNNFYDDACLFDINKVIVSVVAFFNHHSTLKSGFWRRNEFMAMISQIYVVYSASDNNWKRVGPIRPCLSANQSFIHFQYTTIIPLLQQAYFYVRDHAAFCSRVSSFLNKYLSAEGDTCIIIDMERLLEFEMAKIDESSNSTTAVILSLIA
mmetsp:Transcript_23161/g.33645  ORF Transcript_23161/g.33645 Transcript_23161/m.33645 type:complete len:201 (-) Transcript_23161:128-730(-)